MYILHQNICQSCNLIPHYFLLQVFFFEGNTERLKTVIDAIITSTLLPSRCIKASFYIPENTIDSPIKGFRR